MSAHSLGLELTLLWTPDLEFSRSWLHTCTYSGLATVWWTLPNLTLQPAFRAATCCYLQKESEGTSNAAQTRCTPNSFGWPCDSELGSSSLTHWNNTRSIADLHSTPSRIGPRHNETLTASQRMRMERALFFWPISPAAEFQLARLNSIYIASNAHCMYVCTERLV